MRKQHLGNGYMSPKNPVLIFINYALLTIASFIVIGPLLMLFTISFKPDKEFLYSSGPFVLPESFLNIVNYQKVIEQGKFLLGFKNTLILVVVSVTLSIIMGLMVAYVLDRFDFKLKKLILTLFIISVIIPSTTTQVATFSIIKSLGLFNTIFAGIILYVATDIVQIYIFLQYMQKIPRELDESGMMDGASYFRIFFSIILPNTLSAIVTLSLIKAFAIYNDIFIPYIYMPKSDLRTVAMSIYFFNFNKNSQWNIMAAAILLAMLPTLAVYVFCQRMIISGLTAGAVKG